jgi:hypothetical protein
MHFGYRGQDFSPTPLTRRVAVALTALCLPVLAVWQRSEPMKTAHIETTKTQVDRAVSSKKDPRLERLTSFFARLRCPVLPLSADFIRAADENHLDWRLLPSISVVESGGGKRYRNNNIFGWDNGFYPFTSIRSGIHEVAFRLAHSPIYRNHDAIGKLRLYNPDASYSVQVVQVMNRISPAIQIAEARKGSKS